MKRYDPCIPESALPGSMCERADGAYYLAADVDALRLERHNWQTEKIGELLARIAELEKALRGFALHFESRNGIPVERAVIRSDSPDVIEARRVLGL